MRFEGFADGLLRLSRLFDRRRFPSCWIGGAKGINANLGVDQSKVVTANISTNNKCHDEARAIERESPSNGALSGCWLLAPPAAEPKSLTRPAKRKKWASLASATESHRTKLEWKQLPCPAHVQSHLTNKSPPRPLLAPLAFPLRPDRHQSLPALRRPE